MAKIKAYEINGSESKTTEEATTATSTELAAPQQQMALGTISGDIDTSDIVIPRLNIVQNVGELGELFNAGSIVLNKEVELSNGTTPIEVTVLSARKQFVENLDYDSDEKPAVFNTLEEVKAAGGTIEWVNDRKPSFVPVLHLNVLFKAPQGVDYALPLSYEGASYGLAVWTLRGVAYTRAGKNILTAAKFSLRDGLFNGKWELTTKREKFGKNSVFVPVLRNVGRNSAEFVEFIRSIG